VREKDGWRYAGHVGTGFSHAMLEELHGKLWPLRTKSSPFKQRVKDGATTTWVKPKLVGEVKFTEWTAGGEMRHPAFWDCGRTRGQGRCSREGGAPLQMTRPLLVIDGDSFAHRSYHALPKTIRRRDNKGGGAIVGFANFLLRLYEAEQPRAVLVGWDTLDEPTYRHRALDEYQSGREFDTELVDQLDVLPGGDKRHERTEGKRPSRPWR